MSQQGLMEMEARNSPLTNNSRMISLRSTGLLRQPCCSHCLYQEDHHVCLEQTPCRNLVGIICAHAGSLSPQCSSRQHERPQDSYNTLDGPQLSRLDCVGLCLDDRSSPHAREKFLGLACPLRPGTSSNVNAVRLVPPASHTVVIIRLSQLLLAHRDRLLDPTAFGDPTPARYRVERPETTKRKIVPSRPFRPTRPTDDRRTLAQALPERRATQTGLRYSDGHTET